jgi:hypothetical protein
LVSSLPKEIKADYCENFFRGSYISETVKVTVLFPDTIPAAGEAPNL